MIDGIAMTRNEWPPQFEEILRAHLPLLPPDAELGYETELVNLGLDSLGNVMLLMQLEEVLDVVVPDEKLSTSTFATPANLWSTLADCGAL
jgi:acyl carrier protein